MSSNLSDGALILAISRRESEAFEELITRHSKWMIGLATRIIGSIGEAEDLVQEILLKIWLEPLRFDTNRGTALSTWLYTRVKNASLDRLKSSDFKVNSANHNDAAAHDQLTDESASVTCDSHIKEQQFTLLENWIKALPESQRRAVELVYLEGLPQQMVSEMLEKNLKALESTLSRARRSLKVQFAKHYGGKG